MKNELRIGNLFHMISRGSGIAIPMKEVPFKVVELHAFDLRCVAHNINPATVEDWALVKYFDCSPIPLDEEWLVKFGFKKRSNIDDDLDSIYESEIGYCITIKNGRYNFQFPSLYAGEISIVSVHQLQNLYFALTEGNELLLLNAVAKV